MPNPNTPAAAPAEDWQQAPLSVDYLQDVPDKCDRIRWRGRCISMDHIVAVENSAAADLLSNMKTVLFHFQRGDFEKNSRLCSQAVDAIKNAIARSEPAAAASRSPAAAIDTALADLGRTMDSYPTPQEALQALIAWHVDVALDPAVSERAQALVESGCAPNKAENLDLAHELWSAAQLAPGEGIEDGVARLAAILGAAPNNAESRYIVSVVMVKNGPSTINTQNKLYAVQAVSMEEAHGMAIRLAQGDFQEHYMHTVCSWSISADASHPSSLPAMSEEEALKLLEEHNGNPLYFHRQMVLIRAYERARGIGAAKEKA